MAHVHAAVVDVWFATRPAGPLPAWMQAGLSGAEQAQAARYVTEELRANYRFSHWMLRQVLSRYVALDPAAIEIVKDQRGKPQLPQEGVWFNLSHSGGQVAIAVTTAGPVGIDVEAIREMSGQDAIAREYFSPEDREGRTFFEGWTRREARGKATGQGLAGGLEDGWWVESLEAPEGFAAAISMQRPARIRYQKL